MKFQSEQSLKNRIWHHEPLPIEALTLNQKEMERKWKLSLQVTNWSITRTKSSKLKRDVKHQTTTFSFRGKIVHINIAGRALVCVHGGIVAWRFAVTPLHKFFLFKYIFL
jgi:hypothetical protein